MRKCTENVGFSVRITSVNVLNAAFSVNSIFFFRTVNANFFAGIFFQLS